MVPVGLLWLVAVAPVAETHPVAVVSLGKVVAVVVVIAS
jgi:hypothetical protein